MSVAPKEKYFQAFRRKLIIGQAYGCGILKVHYIFLFSETAILLKLHYF
jgi:hypothetical protein